MHARSASDINQHYRTLRPQLLMYMVIGYAAFYLTRKSVNYVLPALQTDLGLDKGDIGLLGSLFYLPTACRSLPPGCGTTATGSAVYGRWPVRHRPAERGVRLWRVADAAAGGLDAERLFQGWGWPPCARLLTHWYSRNERGFWWGCWNMSINIGGAIIPLIAPLPPTGGAGRRRC
jgi:OPA family sugar phosphate sensor protein UhpC-like MFS transporter